MHEDERTEVVMDFNEDELEVLDGLAARYGVSREIAIRIAIEKADQEGE